MIARRHNASPLLQHPQRPRRRDEPPGLACVSRPRWRYDVVITLSVGHLNEVHADRDQRLGVGPVRCAGSLGVLIRHRSTDGENSLAGRARLA